MFARMPAIIGREPDSEVAAVFENMAAMMAREGVTHQSKLVCHEDVLDVGSARPACLAPCDLLGVYAR